MNRVERKKLGQLGQQSKPAANKTEANKPCEVKKPLESLHWANSKVLPQELSRRSFESLLLPNIGSNVKITTINNTPESEGILKAIEFKRTSSYNWTWGQASDLHPQDKGCISYRIEESNGSEYESKTSTGALKIHWN